jgi:hypothetical protein
MLNSTVFSGPGNSNYNSNSPSRISSQKNLEKIPIFQLTAKDFETLDKSVLRVYIDEFKDVG